MVLYVFQGWSDGDPNPVKSFTLIGNVSFIALYAAVTLEFTLIVNSSPIAVTITVNGVPYPSGSSVKLGEGTPVTISVPTEVEA